MDTEERNIIAAIIIVLVGVIIFLCYRLKSLSDVNKQLKNFLYSKIDEIDRLNKKLNERKEQRETTTMKEEYTPQFDYDNIPEQEHVVKTCKQCGKSGEYIGLDSNGLCFDCRQINQKPEPNKDLFKKWYYSQRRNKPMVFQGGALLAAIYIPVKNYYNKKFHKPTMQDEFDGYNRIPVQVTDTHWRCPCCGSENVGFTHCGVCGVLPKFTEKE